MADREELLKTLKELGDEEFKEFKGFLQQLNIPGGSSVIPKCYLEKASRWDTVDKIVETHTQHQSVEVVKKILKKINRNDLVEKLSNTNTGAHDMDPDLTIVLLGHSGVGKSASGNSILGREAFESKASVKPVTTQICEQTRSMFGKNISVIDTPGILCAGVEEKIKTFCLNLLRSSRPKLFLVLLRVGRFTEEDQKAVEAALRVVGDQQFGTCYLLFTSGDALKKNTLDEFINEDVEGPLPDLIQRFSGRYHVFNNEDGGQEQFRELLVKSGTVSSSLCGVPLPGSIMSKSKKYEDIISKSSLISSGSPDVYQLRPKEEEFGTLTRKTVGEKNLNKTNKTILLVGETGAGKSTLINALVNYTMGVKFEENIWFEIVEDKKKNPHKISDKEEDQDKSQTLDVIVYEIFGFEDKTLPFSLTIIDTPGFGNTKGNEHDVIIRQRLFDLFHSKDGVHELSAVGLVMKATVNRVSDQLKYVFDSVVSLFGKNIEKNIVVLITHSHGKTPKNVLQALKAVNIKCAKNEKSLPVHFLFQNCQTEDRTEDTKLLKCSDEITMKGMNQFRVFLEKTAPQTLGKTVDVLKEHIRLTACIQNLQERIHRIELKQNEIKQTQEALEKHEQEKKSDDEFCVEVDEVYKEKETIDGGRWGLRLFYEGAVTCNICEENCHFPGCTMARYPKHCEVMRRGHCTSCTGKCSASEHVKEEKKYVTKTRKAKKTLEDVKKEYEKEHKAKQQNINNLLSSLKGDKQQLHRETNDWLDEAYQHVLNLEQIALNVNSLSTHVHLDYLIEKMKERKDTEKVQKLEEMKKRMGEGSMSDTLRHMFAKLTGWYSSKRCSDVGEQHQTAV